MIPTERFLHFIFQAVHVPHTCLAHPFQFKSSLFQHILCRVVFNLNTVIFYLTHEQERLWKTAAAAGICHRIASTGRSKFEHRIICQKQRNIARTLAKAVMHFWHSIDAFQTTELTLKDQNGECNPDLLKSCKANGTTAEKGQVGEFYFTLIEMPRHFLDHFLMEMPFFQLNV